MHEQSSTISSHVSLDVVQVAGGRLAGVAGADAAVRVFKGIPYAAPPVGELRWHPPQPPPAWEGIRDANAFGPICPQFGPPPGSFYQQEFYLHEEPQSEDCLYLNVWAAESAGARRPVMVWFHGGALIEGSGSLPSFHGETLARKGVVLVTVNYRLGLFGYYAHPELSAESGRHVSGNYGLLDQIAALQWVRANIAAFGGDPDNVTIFGQSAGSMSVFALLVSPLARGLFHRAIGQSGSPFSFREVRTLREAEQASAKLAESRGAASLRALRALPTEALLGPSLEDYRAAGSGLIVDGWSIPDSPAQLMATGQRHDVDLLVGSNADEFTPMGVVMESGLGFFRRKAAQLYGARAEELLRLYPADSDRTALRAQIAIRGDQLFAGMRFWAACQNRQRPGSAYLYYFDRKLPGRDSAFYGAFHSGELYYMFDTLDSTDRPWEVVDRRLADTMTSYWANFAATGDPNGAGLPAWPAHDESDSRVMELGERIGPMPTPKQEQIAFFEREIAHWIEPPARHK